MSVSVSAKRPRASVNMQNLVQHLMTFVKQLLGEKNDHQCVSDLNKTLQVYHYLV